MSCECLITNSTGFHDKKRWYISCSLIQLKELIAYNIKKRERIKLLFIDNKTDKHLIYLRSNHFENQHVLIEQDNGYILIQSDNDIGNEQEVHELDYYKSKLGDNPDAFTDFLSKQIIE